MSGIEPSWLNRHARTDISIQDWKILQAKRLFARTDEWLDRGAGVRLLEDPRLAAVVVDAINHFAGQRYDVWAFVVMPNHLHWLFRARDDWVARLGDGIKKRPSRDRIMHTLKLHTSLECNKVRGQAGTFWQDESYDHCVRDEEELGRIIEYIEMNPVRAGLVREAHQWPYSSAVLRKAKNLAFHEPLPCGAGR